jgi:hypothetical protein
MPAEAVWWVVVTHSNATYQTALLREDFCRAELIYIQLDVIWCPDYLKDSFFFEMVFDLLNFRDAAVG